jgi:hypothetical protein
MDIAGRRRITAPRIVSVSRRTDIPAFYLEWFMNRVAAGYVKVPNPFNPKQISTVGLLPEEVACFVFWTRDPRFLLRQLDHLEARGYHFYCHVTVTGLPPFFEPRAPRPEEAVAAMRQLSRRLGCRRVIWRFDPLILTPLTPPGELAATFRRLADSLEGFVERVVISFARGYRQVEQRLERAVRQEGFDPALFRLSQDNPSPEAMQLVADLAGIAATHGMTMTSCAEPRDLAPWGVLPGRCIDAGLIRDLFAVSPEGGKDGGQRTACRCHKSVDIGMYGTCRHGCLYCYAAGDRSLHGGLHHDPAGTMLLSHDNHER